MVLGMFSKVIRGRKPHIATKAVLRSRRSRRVQLPETIMHMIRSLVCLHIGGISIHNAKQSFVLPLYVFAA
jgi:hypothetical protein